MMKLTVRGVVKEIAERRRYLFFKVPYVLIGMEPDDIRRVEREVNARFPGYGSLGTRGSAIPLEQIDDPNLFPIGQCVEMTVTVGSSVDSYFFGSPPLSVDSIQPLTKN